MIAGMKAVTLGGENVVLLLCSAKCEINKKKGKMAAPLSLLVVPCSLLKPYLSCSIAPSNIKSH